MHRLTTPLAARRLRLPLPERLPVPAASRRAAADAALAAGFLAAMLLDRTGARTAPALLCATLVAGALVFRRTAPLTAYAVGTAALSAEALWCTAGPVSPYANLLGLYSLGLYGTRTRAWLGPFTAYPGMVAYFAGADGERLWNAMPAGVLFLWLLVWAIGYGTARRLEERDASRRRLRREAVAGERARMARELHDLIGHTVNLMLVQAGATRRLLDRDPDRAREVLGQLEDTGRDALDELDRVLGLLRRTAAPGLPLPDPTGADLPVADEADGRPGLADLPRLAARLAQAGIAVDARVDPGRGELPSSIDVSAYRIVQEALTNTVKHARAGAAAVTVRRAGDLLDIEVGDDGHGAPAGYVPGRGLLGIGERVAVLGGTLDHGPGERGGFRLHVRLPVR
ncbi:histidine kinase [Streptomyces bambusae]|uniref:sensor histidine kinase n=1 Tax=Streptomyces bambusae TaxID=1550616 RepID=UPI001CFDB697|nr:histidine kinase [Streptomyces bambusae]MCB5167544.1 histidine kinase [Streptomyces bambusae]